MSELIDDDPFGTLALTDGEAAKPLPLGLTTPDTLDDVALRAAELAYRMCEVPGCNMVLFTAIDDDGNEVWDNVAVEYASVQPETEQSKWKRVMGWPAGVPDSAVTIAAVTKHHRWADAVMHAEIWYAIRAARAAVGVVKPIQNTDRDDQAGKASAAAPAPPRRGLTA
jgi:hypothetical protein